MILRLAMAIAVALARATDQVIQQPLFDDPNRPSCPQCGRALRRDPERMSGWAVCPCGWHHGPQQYPWGATA